MKKEPENEEVKQYYDAVYDLYKSSVMGKDINPKEEESLDENFLKGNQKKYKLYVTLGEASQDGSSCVFTMYYLIKKSSYKKGKDTYKKGEFEEICRSSDKILNWFLKNSKSDIFYNYAQDYQKMKDIENSHNGIGDHE